MEHSHISREDLAEIKRILRTLRTESDVRRYLSDLSKSRLSEGRIRRIIKEARKLGWVEPIGLNRKRQQKVGSPAHQDMRRKKRTPIPGIDYPMPAGATSPQKTVARDERLIYVGGGGGLPVQNDKSAPFPPNVVRDGDNRSVSTW